MQMLGRGFAKLSCWGNLAFRFSTNNPSMKIVIIGGGIIGTTHAFAAIKAGHQVIQLERDAHAGSASVRNFGLVWISGRKSGAELDAAIYSRQLWEEIHTVIPEMIFRRNGSLTLAKNPAELRVMEECMKKEDALARGWELLDREQTQIKNPILHGDFLASLWCPLDATVEPGSILNSMRSYLLRKDTYLWRNHCDVVDVRGDSGKAYAVASNGEVFEGDHVIVCPGADHTSLFKEQFDTAPIRRVRLQMMSTAPLNEKSTTSIADGDSMRYYPGYAVPALANLPPQHPVAEKHHMQLLLVQRADGTLTIGDTHEYDEPFEFKLNEDPFIYLHDVASALFGYKLPPITHRWDGVYSQRTDGAICDRRKIATNITSVTGPGGRGNTLAPAIAEATIKGLA
jgi:FAD dependent oxidoreductase TIGR03364